MGEAPEASSAVAETEGSAPERSEEYESRQPTRAALRKASFVHSVRGSAPMREGELERWTPWRPVWSAAKRGDALLLKRLIEADQSLVNRPNASQETALHVAALHGHTTCVALLLEMGARSCLSVFGETPVSLAAQNGHAEIVQHLCRAAHLGTASEQIELLLSAATARGDTATAVILHRHLKPALQLPKEEYTRRMQPLEREREEADAIARRSEEIRELSILQPPKPRPPLGPVDAWTCEDVEHWAQETLGLEASERQFLRAISRYHITGRTMLQLTKGEQRTLLQRVGIPSQQRRGLLESLASLQGRPRIFAFTDLRLLPLAIGNAATFRVIGYVRAAMSTPLHTCRRFVQAAKELTRPVPEPFAFLSMQNEKIPKDKESATLVSALGFVVIVVPAPP